MDGDGGFYLCRSKRYPNRLPYLQFSIAGTEAFCLSARDYLADAADAPQRKLSRRKNPWLLSYERGSAGRIYDLLYDGATVYLARKKVAKPEPAFVRVDAVRVKALRKRRGLTQEQLCANADVSYQTVFRMESQWERASRARNLGERGPHGYYMSTVCKVAAALGIEPSELVKAS
jgi:DNA-binding XRE family transcriptional regulator